jgi:hypothetical protein
LYSKLKPWKNNSENRTREQQIWVSFIYTGNCIWKVTKHFQNTNINVAYKTTSTIGKLLNEKQKENPYEQNGIYKLACQSYHKVYIGQTGRNLTGYKEHIRNIRFNKDEHILNKQHQFGPMTGIMEIVEYTKKGTLMNIKENFHIYHLNQINKLIEDQKHDKENHNQNDMFGIIVNISTRPHVCRDTQVV